MTGLVKRVATDYQELSVAMSGGVAHNRGVVDALSHALGVEVAVPARPDTVGALGAAFIARERSRDPAGYGGDEEGKR